MPKETVYGKPSESHFDVTLDGEGFSQIHGVGGTGTNAAVLNTPVIDVIWHRESQMVQVVSKLKEFEVFVAKDDSDVMPVFYGYHVDLDREGINALIRKLRRARDQAFGRDE